MLFQNIPQPSATATKKGKFRILRELYCKIHKQARAFALFIPYYHLPLPKSKRSALDFNILYVF